MTGFNFEAAIADSRKQSESRLLSCIVLGSSGAGKSSLLGTSGLKTLYVYFTGESHGVKAAQAAGGDIVPVCVDHENGKQLSADESYKRLVEIVNSPEAIAKLGVKFIAIDGASEIEATIRATSQWKQGCQTTQGKHNKFAEPSETVSMFRPIIAGLKSTQLKTDCHFAMTCMLDVKVLGSAGEIEEAQPRLLGFSVAESVVQQYDDVITCGKMQKDGKVKYKLQMMTDLSKTSKDEQGNLKRSMNFACRVAGKRDLPAYLDASMAELIKFKATK